MTDDEIREKVARAICISDNNPNHPCECEEFGLDRTGCADMLVQADAALTASGYWEIRRALGRLVLACTRYDEAPDSAVSTAEYMSALEAARASLPPPPRDKT